MLITLLLSSDLHFGFIEHEVVPYNFSMNAALAGLTNPCNIPVIKKISKRPQVIQWQIVEKERLMRTFSEQ